MFIGTNLFIMNLLRDMMTLYLLQVMKSTNLPNSRCYDFAAMFSGLSIFSRIKQHKYNNFVTVDFDKKQCLKFLISRFSSRDSRSTLWGCMTVWSCWIVQIKERKKWKPKQIKGKGKQRQALFALAIRFLANQLTVDEHRQKTKINISVWK